ncbi:putative tlr signaling inhibitor [Raccoonpox virus]|uniref:Putative TLR signaling inhibitor, alpha-amanatin sensitivity n=1 Tax=Raccoon poxvirus TaxID=10256 RepID=A0A0G3FZW8_RACVI|nr:putative TLR signaling inhibitor, alpha-amanatin sensitivity [Raccoonpox virus]AKJ93659.1 putative TLR signaling inhibitor, alpha-amanatin sensitivity [Raccoonpox virus]AOP31290.1 putative tlr signaling inhibitor [Raccoonpox virus]
MDGDSSAVLLDDIKKMDTNKVTKMLEVLNCPSAQNNSGEDVYVMYDGAVSSRYIDNYIAKYMKQVNNQGVDVFKIVDRFLAMNSDELRNTKCNIIKELMTYKQLAIDHYGSYVEYTIKDIHRNPNYNINLFRKIKRTRYDTFKIDPVDYVKKVIGFVYILTRYDPVYIHVLYDNVTYDYIDCFADYLRDKYFQN